MLQFPSCDLPFSSRILLITLINERLQWRRIWEERKCFKASGRRKKREKAMLARSSKHLSNKTTHYYYLTFEEHTNLSLPCYDERPETRIFLTFSEKRQTGAFESQPNSLRSICGPTKMSSAASARGTYKFFVVSSHVRRLGCDNQRKLRTKSLNILSFDDVKLN